MFVNLYMYILTFLSHDALFQYAVDVLVRVIQPRPPYTLARSVKGVNCTRLGQVRVSQIRLDPTGGVNCPPPLSQVTCLCELDRFVRYRAHRY
jgi:hypothetical protein